MIIEPAEQGAMVVPIFLRHVKLRTVVVFAVSRPLAVGRAAFVEAKMSTCDEVVLIVTESRVVFPDLELESCFYLVACEKRIIARMEPFFAAPSVGP